MSFYFKNGKQTFSWELHFLKVTFVVLILNKKQLGVPAIIILGYIYIRNIFYRLFQMYFYDKKK